MNKMMAAMRISNALSRVAMEEASRVGQRRTDLEHLLLALVLEEGTAGQVLRREGITLEAARTAVADAHAEQLAGVGIETTWPDEGRIVYHETSGYEWTERSLAVFRRAGEGTSGDYAAAVLEELLDEPSGLVAAILTRLGTSTSTIRAALHEVRDLADPSAERREDTGERSAARDSFVPASHDQVWAILTDPGSMPRWDPMAVAAVSDVPTTPVTVSDEWTAHAPTHRPDGRRLRTKPEFRTQRVRLVSLQEGRAIAWRYSYPDAVDANRKLVGVELQPVAGGTRVRVTVTWQPHPRRTRRPLLALIARPWLRLILPMQASAVGEGIARAFR